MINLIAAISENRVIGRDNQLPWHLSKDLIRFKKLTSGHPVIMGRKTFESIGKPLPNRTNIVITRHDYKADGITVAHSLEEAIQKAKELDSEIFILGGGQIFEQAIDLADRLYLTVIHGDYQGDVYFPEYKDKFKKEVFKAEDEENDTKFTFFDLEK